MAEVVLTRGPTSSRFPKLGNSDWLFRVRPSESATGTFHIIGTPTENVTRPITHLMGENLLLRDIVKNLWQVYKYNQEYQTFILGEYSDEQFSNIADRYAQPFQPMPQQELIFVSELLLNILAGPMTSSDLSVLLNVDPEDIERTLISSSNFLTIDMEQREDNVC